MGQIADLLFMPQVSRLLWSAKILSGVLAGCWRAPSRTLQALGAVLPMSIMKGALRGKLLSSPPVGDWAFLGAERASYSSSLTEELTVVSEDPLGRYHLPGIRRSSDGPSVCGMQF